MDATSPQVNDETSARYEGWRIVGVCFLLATFGWALGFYGQSVYLAELQRVHGWPASTIATATTFFYLVGAFLVAFVSEAMRALGPRNCLLAGVGVMAFATSCSDRSPRPGNSMQSMCCSHSDGPAPASVRSPTHLVCGSTRNVAWRSALR